MLIAGVDYGRAKWGTKYENAKTQNRFKGGNGAVRVSDRDEEDELITFTLPRLTAAQFTALKAYLTVTANYAENTWSMTDDWGTVRTVRWWDSKLRFTEQLGRFYTATIQVRVES